MNEMRKLMEAVEQLNEYLLRDGDSIKTLLRLNVFGDMGMLEDPVLFYDDYEEGGSPSHEWLNVVQDYQGEAEERMLQIQDEAKNGRKLTDAEAQAAENTWYDGSDSYETEEEAVENLPGIYDNQLNVVENILHGLVDEEWLDEANQGGKTETQVSEGASSRQWEIAINNLIGEGDEKYGVRGPGAAQTAVWEWVRHELHGMLDFQPENDGGGLGHENVVGRNLRRAFGGPDEQR